MFAVEIPAKSASKIGVKFGAKTCVESGAKICLVLILGLNMMVR